MEVPALLLGVVSFALTFALIGITATATLALVRAEKRAERAENLLADRQRAELDNRPSEPESV